MRRRHQLDRRLQRVEALVGQERRDIGGDTAARIGFIDDDPLKVVSGAEGVS